MPYPEQSDWNSPTPRSAWYAMFARGVQRICSTDGLNFLIDLQIALRDRLATTGPLPSFAGTVSEVEVSDFDWSGNVSGPGWDRTLLIALYAVAARDRAPIAYLQSIMRDAGRGGALSPATQQVALWVAYWSTSWTAAGTQIYGTGSPNEILIPVGSSLPQIGVRPPAPSNRVRSSGVTCVDESTPVQTIPPLSASVFTRFSPWLVFGVLATAAAGLVVLTNKTPRNIEIRGGHR